MSVPYINVKVEGEVMKAANKLSRIGPSVLGTKGSYKLAVCRMSLMHKSKAIEAVSVLRGSYLRAHTKQVSQPLFRGIPLQP